MVECHRLENKKATEKEWRHWVNCVELDTASERNNNNNTHHGNLTSAVVAQISQPSPKFNRWLISPSLLVRKLSGSVHSPVAAGTANNTCFFYSSSISHSSLVRNVFVRSHWFKSVFIPLEYYRLLQGFT